MILSHHIFFTRFLIIYVNTFVFSIDFHNKMINVKLIILMGDTPLQQRKYRVTYKHYYSFEFKTLETILNILNAIIYFVRR